jgi:transposase
MQSITTIGLDIAKSVFQVHGVDAAGQAVVRRQLKRRQVIAFSRSCRPAWSALRRAPHPIIGRNMDLRELLRVAPNLEAHLNQPAMLS